MNKWLACYVPEKLKNCIVLPLIQANGLVAITCPPSWRPYTHLWKFPEFQTAISVTLEYIYTYIYRHEIQ